MWTLLLCRACPGMPFEGVAGSIAGWDCGWRASRDPNRSDVID